MNTDEIMDETIIENINGQLDIFDAIGDSHGFQTTRQTSGRQPIFDLKENQDDELYDIEGVTD